MQATVYKIDKQQGPTVQHRELYSLSCEKNYNGKEYEKVYICVYIYIHLYNNHFAVHLKLTQHFKLTILQFKKKKRALRSYLWIFQYTAL